MWPCRLCLPELRRLGFGAICTVHVLPKKAALAETFYCFERTFRLIGVGVPLSVFRGWCSVPAPFYDVKA